MRMRKLIVMTVLFCVVVFALVSCRSVNNTDADSAKVLLLTHSRARWLQALLMNRPRPLL